MSGPSSAQWEWAASNDTGISSAVIWTAMTGTGLPRYSGYGASPPQDPSDFGRCHRLLAKFPEWRSRLGEVAEKHPRWAPLVREWGRLERIYLEDMPAGASPRLYDLMQDLLREAGW